jgi:hypothetical protein
LTSNAVNRREFLLFKKVRGQRVAELSCERLFMRVVDSQLTRGANVGPDNPWAGEPPRVVDEITTHELFADLERELRGVDVVRVVDAAWLTSAELRQRLDSVLDEFRAAGGRVDTADGPRSQPEQQLE